MNLFNKNYKPCFLCGKGCTNHVGTLPKPAPIDPPEKGYSLDSILPFGKHKGSALWLVMANDLDYIVWCVENVGNFIMDNEAYTEYLELTKE